MSDLGIVLIGAGGHAKSCIDAIESQGLFRIFGLVGFAEQVGDTVLGYEVIGTERDLPQIRKNCKNAFVAVGQIKSPTTRIDLHNILLDWKFNLPVIQAPSAYVSKHSRIGSGTLVMAQAAVMPGVNIGTNCIINSKSLIEHDAQIGKHSHISTGAVINGNARIGEGSFVGSGAVVMQGVEIGNNCVIGMGAVVRRQVPDLETVIK